MVGLPFRSRAVSVPSADPHKHEIIIVRRHSGDHDDGHHGGVWKIAFADFMTAMMCFFLVMWLINAANEQTKASVASYFNPVKLIDRNSSRKGLEDIGDGPNAVGSDAQNPQDASPEAKAGTEGQGQTGPASDPSSQEAVDAEARSDESLFADPYAVLAEIAAETGKLQNISSRGEGGAQTSGPATGASGGESYRDPFAPDFWSQHVATPDETMAMVEESTPSRSERDQASDGGSSRDGSETLDADPDEAVPADDAQQPVEAGAEAIEAAREVRDELKAAFAADDQLADNIEVKVRENSVVISITDEFDFGMFEIGSAVPRGELVRAMEKIGRIVQDRSGAVIVNGHTDARPFRSRQYDNWRLSSARAQSAYYMLVRGGLDETRVKSVAGFADRQLKFPDRPMADANRRIEILIETGS
ncbi:MAG: MotB family protein [Rhizobiaceae bacterium]|nr:MotB family protein [Rhizobiaceae bacterium]MCV0407010.1 MotB family protein [Rhizobiaceae bacterium]